MGVVSLRTSLYQQSNISLLSLDSDCTRNDKISGNISTWVDTASVWTEGLRKKNTKCYAEVLFAVKIQKQKPLAIRSSLSSLEQIITL